MSGAVLRLALALALTAGDGGSEGDPPDAGPPSSVEINGLQIPIAADPNAPGHRPIEGAVDDAAPRRVHGSASDNPGAAETPLGELLESRAAELTNCAIWSPDGTAVRGWLSVEWRVEIDGSASRFHVIESSLASPLVERCLTREMGQWHFPPPSAPGLVRHSFYFAIPARADLQPEPLP